MPTVSQSYSTQTYRTIQGGYSASSEPKAENRHGPASSTAKTNDSITLSEEGQRLSRNSSSASGTEGKEKQASLEEKGITRQPLTSEQVKQLSELKKRDSEVKAHEQAHLAAAGQYAAGGASFSYKMGPDGKRYATGGEVPIDLSKERSPEATIQKMRTVKRAALAPATPSSADRSIAAQATAKEAQAMKEVLTNSKEELTQGPLSQTDKEDHGSRTGTSEAISSGAHNKSSPMPPVAELTRRTMTAAYQSMAAMAN